MNPLTDRNNPKVTPKKEIDYHLEKEGEENLDQMSLDLAKNVSSVWLSIH